MGDNKNMEKKKDKKISKIKEQLARLRAKLKVDDVEHKSTKLKPKLKSKSKPIKIKTKPKVEPKRKAKEEKQKKLGPKRKANEEKRKRVEAKRKAKEEKRKRVEAKRKANEEKRKRVEAKRKAKEEKRKRVEAKRKVKEEKRKKVEAKRKAKEEKRKKVEAEEKRKAEEEEKRKAEEEAKRTYEEELEEQLTEEEITGFQLEKTDMDKMCNKVCEIIADYENNGILQSQLWKKLKLSSRDGSRLALKLERMGMITREKILEKERWTYKLIIKKIPISTKSIENAPCLTCEVQSKCSIDGEISPKTCKWIEDWVLIELKNK